MSEPEDETPSVWRAFRSAFPALFGLHLGALALDFLVAGPIVALSVHRAVATSGRAALSDTEILAFVLRPSGFLLALLIATLWIGFHLFAYSAQLVTARYALRGQDTSIRHVAAALVPHLPALASLILRFLLQMLAIAVPFVAAIAGIAYAQLHQKDINYYLEARPPEFLLALLLTAIIGVIGLVVLIRTATQWFLALPIVLFTPTPPGDARKISRIHMRGHRIRVFLVLSLWIFVPAVATALANAPWPILALEAAGWLQHRIGVLALVLGTLLAVSTAVALFIGFLATAILCFYHYRFFQRRETGVDEAPLPVSAVTARLPWGLLGALAVVGIATAVWLSYHALDASRPGDSAVVIAHRGASAMAPENTLAAIQAGIDATADWVEIDVQETAAGEVLVIHDRDLMRLARNPLTVRDATPEALADIDIGSWFDPRFADQRVPTLGEVLGLFKERGKLLIELKYYGSEDKLEERVIERVEAAGMTDRVAVMSLSPEGIARFRKLRPEWRAGLLSTASVGDLTRLDVDFLALNATAARSDVVRRAHAAGISIFVWTVNDPAAMSSMLSRGVDGLITDQPAIARKVLRERADLNPGERLLVDLAARLNRLPTPREP